MIVTKILPILISSIVNFWNPSTGPAVTNGVYMRAYESIQQSGLPPNSVLQIDSTNPDVKAWTVVQNVTFEAVEPEERWVVPFTGSTGIAIANPSDSQTVITFVFIQTGHTRIETITLAPKVSVSFFPSYIFRNGILLEDGAVIIRADEPIGVWAAECTDICTGVPVY